MNYADLTANQRDVLLAVVSLDIEGEANPSGVHRFYEERFGPISDGAISRLLSELVDASLSVKERSESDGRVWVYRPTDAGHEVIHQALRERLRWILPPEPTPDHAEQTTLVEVLAA